MRQIPTPCLLPDDPMKLVFSFLDPASVLNYGHTSHEAAHQVSAYRSKEHLFYLVGERIDLYETHCYYGGFLGYGEFSVGPYGKRREDFTAQEIFNSLPNLKNVRLFSSYRAAQEYEKLSRSNSFNEAADLFINQTASAIFAVGVCWSPDIHQTPITVTEDIPPCPAPPRPRRERIPCILLPAKDIKHVYAARFNATLFERKNIETKLNVLWFDAKRQFPNNLQQSTIAALKSIFTEYNRPLITMMRHHKHKVANILTYLDTTPNISDLHKLIKAEYKEATIYPRVNKAGEYYKILSFAHEKLKAISKMNQLEGIEEYFSEVRSISCVK